MKKNNLQRVRKCFFLLFFFSTFAYFGCKPDLKLVVKYTTTAWNFVGKNNQKSSKSVKTEIGFFKEELDELEKLYAASGLGSTEILMKNLEEKLSKKACHQFSGYYKTFLPFLVIGKDPKKSMQDFVNEKPELKLDFDPITSILTFPIVDTINGMSKTIIANIKIGDILEKQKSIQDIEQIQSIEPYSEINPNPPPKEDTLKQPLTTVKSEPKISMDSLLEVVIRKHSRYKIDKYNWGYQIKINNLPIPFVEIKDNKIVRINMDPEKGTSDYHYDYFDRNRDGYLDSIKINNLKIPKK
ncbi:MAG: hypothetical protein SH848_22315 [Saprospiraceae bacterium]|nr:hypothetical protein [Saprospiraceae bacterium]